MTGWGDGDGTGGCPLGVFEDAQVDEAVGGAVVARLGGGEDDGGGWLCVGAREPGYGLAD